MGLSSSWKQGRLGAVNLACSGGACAAATADPAGMHVSGETYGSLTVTEQNKRGNKRSLLLAADCGSLNRCQLVRQARPTGTRLLAPGMCETAALRCSRLPVPVASSALACAARDSGWPRSIRLFAYCWFPELAGLRPQRACLPAGRRRSLQGADGAWGLPLMICSILVCLRSTWRPACARLLRCGALAADLLPAVGMCVRHLGSGSA